MKRYNELSEEQKESARELHPDDYKKWKYTIEGNEIYSSSLIHKIQIKKGNPK